MTHSTVRRRSGVARIAGIVAATALAGSGVVATSTTAFAEETAGADVPSLQTFDASDFKAQAAELPAGLINAIDRDLGVSAAEYLANAAAANVASEVIATLGDAGTNINGAVFDSSSQALTVYVGSDADVALVEGTGAKVVVGDAPASEVPADHEFAPYADFKGGYGYVVEVEDEGFGRCSAGFNGFAAGGPAILTAGHCNADEYQGAVQHIEQTQPWSPSHDGTPEWVTELFGGTVGAGGQFHFGDGHDAGLIPAAGDWTFPAAVSEWGNNGIGDPTSGEVSVANHVDPVVGMEICRSGASSGFHCGDILEVDRTEPIGGPEVTGFVTDACATQGDSGGSFLSGNAAVGTLTGGSAAFDPDPVYACDAWQDGYTTFAYPISGSDYSSLAYFSGFELKVRIATPTVTAPADGAETGPKPTFKGSVDHGSPNYTAYVTVDGKQYDAAVDTGGDFSVRVSDELEPGTHSYELVIGYGNESRSEVVSGSITVVEGPVVEQLVVSSPGDGQTTSSARPSFDGSGQAGAEVTLTVGDDSYGSATVADDGSWTIEPDSDLPKAQRFDAVVTQSFEGDEQSVTVADLGIRVSDVTITSPEDGSEVAGDVVFEGTAEPGSDIWITLIPAGAEGDDSEGMALTTFNEGDDDTELWEGEFTFEGNAWTFTPAEPLENGEYTVEVDAQLGDDTDLGASSASSTFTVVKGGGGDAGGGDDDGGLPDTGSSTLPLIIGAIVLVLAGGGALVVVRARRNSSSVA